MSELRLFCSNCFGDRYLRQEHFPSAECSNGKCDYCGLENAKLLEPESIRDLLESVVGCYRESTGGKTLIEFLRRDWEWFTTSNMSLETANLLLSDVLKDNSIPTLLYEPVPVSGPDAVAAWTSLREELKHENRFFPKSAIDQSRFRELLDYLLCGPKSVSSAWYRARIQQDGVQHSADQMGPPPKHKATHGRANPAGIPYLYAASDRDTAVSEVRPHTGEAVTLAVIGIPDEARLVDLRKPKSATSPLYLSDEQEIPQFRNDLMFLELLGLELKRPVVPNSAAFDYVPSQYLCELIKQCGFDGVIYPSSVGRGTNIAVFHPAQATIHSIGSVNISRVSVEISPE
jgi:RES domain-containing protein